MMVNYKSKMTSFLIRKLFFDFLIAYLKKILHQSKQKNEIVILFLLVLVYLLIFRFFLSIFSSKLKTRMSYLDKVLHSVLYLKGTRKVRKSACITVKFKRRQYNKNLKKS